MAKPKDIFYIERRPEGDYKVIKDGSDKASVVKGTQEKAIDAARKLDPDFKILVERVRDTDVGGRDQWRKP